MNVALGDERFSLLVSPVSACAPTTTLSSAEAHVVELARAGLSNAAIAKARGTSARTVANQLRGIFEKLGVASRSDLFTWIGAAGRYQLQDDSSG